MCIRDSSDTMKWSGPNNYDGSYQTKDDLAEAAKVFLSSFKDFSFDPGGVGPENTGAYWGGSLYSDKGEQTTDPSGVRIYGIWSATTISTLSNWWRRFKPRGQLTLNITYQIMA